MCAFCAQGAADYLKEKGLAGRGVYIGYDYRFASEDFAAAAAEVLAANGHQSLPVAQSNTNSVRFFRRDH